METKSARGAFPRKTDNRFRLGVRSRSSCGKQTRGITRKNRAMGKKTTTIKLQLPRRAVIDRSRISTSKASVTNTKKKCAYHLEIRSFPLLLPRRRTILSLSLSGARETQHRGRILPSFRAAFLSRTRLWRDCGVEFRGCRDDRGFVSADPSASDSREILHGIYALYSCLLPARISLVFFLSDWRCNCRGEQLFVAALLARRIIPS